MVAMRMCDKDWDCIPLPIIFEKKKTNAATENYLLKSEKSSIIINSSYILKCI